MPRATGSTGGASAVDEACSTLARLDPPHQRTDSSLLEISASKQCLIMHQQNDRAVSKHPPLPDDDGATADSQGKIEIVGDDGDGGALPRQAVDALSQQRFAGGIETGRRLVEHQQRRVSAGGHHCERKAPPLALRQLERMPVTQSREAPFREMAISGGRGQFLADAAGEELALRVLEA